MGKIPTREEAWELLTRYNQDAFHLQHAETVEGIMRYFARKLGLSRKRISGALQDFCMTWILKNIRRSTV